MVRRSVLHRAVAADGYRANLSIYDEKANRRNDLKNEHGYQQPTH